jgi:hypothetical protein
VQGPTTKGAETEIADEAYTKVVELCANVVCSKMDEVGAENYITHNLETECGRRVEVTVRNTDGKTPAEKLYVAEQRIAELEALLNEAKVIYFAPPLDLPPISRSDHLYVLERFNGWLPRVDAALTQQLEKEQG